MHVLSGFLRLYGVLYEKTLSVFTSNFFAKGVRSRRTHRPPVRLEGEGPPTPRRGGVLRGRGGSRVGDWGREGPGDPSDRSLLGRPGLCRPPTRPTTTRTSNRRATTRGRPPTRPRLAPASLSRTPGRRASHSPDPKEASPSTRESGRGGHSGGVPWAFRAGGHRGGEGTQNGVT